jgi:electron transport complex protein RnfA
MLRDMLYIILVSVFANNYVLQQTTGICPFLGVSKKFDQASGMGIAVTFVMVAATAVTWPIQKLVLEKPINEAGDTLEYLQTIVFILVIASLVQFVEIILKKFIPALYKSLGVYLPLITTNCAVLRIAQDNFKLEYVHNFGDAICSAIGAGIGFLFAMVLFAGVRSRIENSPAPKSFKGLPITLIAAAIVALAFYGFAGIVDGMLGM